MSGKKARIIRKIASHEYMKLLQEIEKENIKASEIDPTEHSYRKLYRELKKVFKKIGKKEFNKHWGGDKTNAYLYI